MIKEQASSGASEWDRIHELETENDGRRLRGIPEFGHPPNDPRRHHLRRRVGVRPASDGTGAAITLQVTTDAPWCPRGTR
jgi:hypothetical protein